MSNIKYHVNPETYEVSVCSAQIKCRFADNPDVRHFDKDNMENALKYAEELAEKKYSINSNLSKQKTENELNHVEANEKRISYDELQSRKKEYFSNLRKASPKKLNTARKEELTNVLDRYRTRRKPNKDVINKVNGAILDGSDSSIIDAMKLLRRESESNLYFIHELTDEEIVDTVRDRDLLEDHIDFRNTYHRKTSFEKEVMSASNEITDETREKLYNSAKYAINDTRFKRKEENLFVGRVPVAVAKLSLKHALNSNDDQRILKNLKKLKDAEHTALQPQRYLGLYEKEWERYSKPIEAVIKDYNYARFKQAFINRTQE